MSEPPITAVERVHLDFEVIKDAWQVLQLTDGSLLRLKLVVVDVHRVENPASGDRTYEIEGQLMVIPDKKQEQSGTRSREHEGERDK